MAGILQLILKLLLFLSQQLCPSFENLDLLAVIGVLVVKLELKALKVQVFANLFKGLLFELQMLLLGLLPGLSFPVQLLGHCLYFAIIGSFLLFKSLVVFLVLLK